MICQDTWSNHRSEHQRWFIEPVPTDEQYVTIVSGGDDRCLTIQGAASQMGASLTVWRRTQGPEQRWRLRRTSQSFGDYWTLTNKASGLVAAVGAHSVDDDAPVIQWADAGLMDQKWYIVPAQWLSGSVCVAAEVPRPEPNRERVVGSDA